MVSGTKGRWKASGKEHKTCNAVGNEAITSFNGSYKFLSNFYWSHVEFEGISYPSVEHAFQAAKLLNNEDRRSHGFPDSSLSFGGAKQLGRKVDLRGDWHQVRVEVMAACLKSKFNDAHLRARLLATGERELVDGHSGSPDLIWGYHFPSQAGENRLGKLLMDLRRQLHGEQHVVLNQSCLEQQGKPDFVTCDGQKTKSSKEHVALYHLDWPVKCLHDGLPSAYAECICGFARSHWLGGSIVTLARRKICIALCGASASIDSWEVCMRTEKVDVNSRGRPCRERMLVCLMRSQEITQAQEPVATLRKETSPALRWVEAENWDQLCRELQRVLRVSSTHIAGILGPEPPELPQVVKYTQNRNAVILDGKSFPLCLNDREAPLVSEELLGELDLQIPRGVGEEVKLSCDNGRPSIFGGKFAREMQGLLSVEECDHLIKLSEKFGYGLAGSRGFNPFARFALRCLLDAPAVASAVTKRLQNLLPQVYPPGSRRQLVGVNERMRFLKYHPGMHHSGDHTDCAFEDSARGRSFLTVQLYLNDAFQGGRTTFVSDHLVPVEPSPGGAVVFDHELYHRGGMVTKGTKYAVRMDVLYGHEDWSGAAAVNKLGQQKDSTSSGHARRHGGRWGRA